MTNSDFDIHKTNSMNTIKSPDEVALLMREMWIRHVAGIQQRRNNVFIVELPPETDENEDNSLNKGIHYEPEELYGVWI